MPALYALLDKLAAGFAGPLKDYIWIVTVLVMLCALLTHSAWTIMSIKRDVRETGIRLGKLERRVKRNAKLGRQRNDSLEDKLERILSALGIPTVVE